MAKFFGNVGFVTTVERKEKDSVWVEEVIEKPYYGDTYKETHHNRSSSEQIIDDISLNNEISIIADSFAYQNTQHIRYVTYMGAKWSVTSVTGTYPRLILTIGGLYHGPEPKPAED
jgi:hypothetical protein